MIQSPVTIWKKFDLTQELNVKLGERFVSPGGFSVQEIRFDGHPVGGERVRVYARFTTPCETEKHPVLLLLPDANETGEELADYFAKKGYATLIPDYCGEKISEKNDAEEYTAYEFASEGGAAYEGDAERKYTQYPSCVSYANYKNVEALDKLERGSVEESHWFEWAYVTLYALEYLKTRADVTTIGITGVRLGGEIAFMCMLSPDLACGAAINAVGWRSQLSCPKFGGTPLNSSGEEAEAVRTFVAGAEAQSYAPFIKCPVLMCCSMEDPFFDCDRAYDTFVRLGNKADSAIVYSSDSGSCVGPSAIADLDLFLGRYLKGREIYIPKPMSLEMTEDKDGEIQLTAVADGDALVESVTVYYAEGIGGQTSSRRSWQRLKKASGAELTDNAITLKTTPFLGAEYVYGYAFAKFFNGFKTVSPVVGKKLQKTGDRGVKERVVSSGEKDGFTIADCKEDAIGAIFLEKERMPEKVVGYGGIRGVYSPSGIRTYRLGSPRFRADEGSMLKMDVYANKDANVKISVEMGESRDCIYSLVVPIKGGGKWKRLLLRAEDFKEEKRGVPLTSFKDGAALAIRSLDESVKVPVTNVLWL